MERQKLNWVILGVGVLLVLGLFSLASENHGSGCRFENFSDKMKLDGYGTMQNISFSGGIIIILLSAVLALLVVWILRQLNSNSRGKKK